MRKRFEIKLHVNVDHIDKDDKIKGSGVTWFEDEDMFMWNNDTWEVSPKDLINAGIPSVSSDAVNLQDKLIYRYPQLDLPREKVDLLKERFNCRVIRDEKKADVSIVSMKFMDNLFHREWGCSKDMQTTYKFFKYLKEDLNILSDSALIVLRDFMNAAPKDAMVNIKYSKTWETHLVTDKLYNQIENYLNSDVYGSTNGRDWLLAPTKFRAYNDLITSTTQIVLDTEICNIIDEDLAVLGNEKYNEVKEMVTSSDMDNRSLALEMLANCNIEKSFDIVSGIYYWHYDWLKATTNWNTVNVKAFRKRMKAYEGNHGIQSIHPFNQYLNTLAEDRKLTKFAVDHTRTKLYNTFLNNVVGSESDVFKVDLSSIYINEELTNKIITNE